MSLPREPDPTPTRPSTPVLEGASGAVRVCPECGRPTQPLAARGLCPRCLVVRALASPAPVVGEGFQVPEVEELNALVTGLEVRGLLGKGGMGAVYEAWQRDLARPVALKILPADLVDSGDFVPRFRREAQLMARLDHPNVARVYETGFTAAGDPFILMELIRGDPITVHAARRPLGTVDRLDLLAAVCRGVQHAHQKGLIHRDIKPSNVLVGEVDARPVAKVIDFGLARPLGDATRDDVAWRSQGAGVGTPGYLSPEQAAGGEVDTRTDVYALGALAHEVLTGAPPLEPGRVDGQGLSEELRAILARALAPAAEDRYATAAALGEDLARVGRHEPVEAMGGARAYRLGRFLRRHRGGVVAAAGVLVLLLVGMGLLVRYSVLTRKAEQLAEARLRQGERLIGFMLGDLHARLSQVGRLDLLESVIVETEKFYDAASGDPSAEGLRNRARARMAIGLVRNAQGRPDLARAGYQAAIRLFEAAEALVPERPEEAENHVQAWNSLAVSHHVAQEAGPAEKAYLEALAINARARAREPDNVGWIDTRASLLHNLASMYEMVGRLDDAERSYGEALALWEPLLARHPDQPELLEHLADFRQSLAFLHGRRGRLAEAEQANQEALRLQERLVRRDPANMAWLERLAGTQQNIAELHFRRGDLDAAEAWMSRYVPVREELARRDPANAGWQHALADALRNRARLWERRGKDAAAAEDHGRAWGISEVLLAAGKAPAEMRTRWIEGLRDAVPVFARLADRAREAGDAVEESRHRKTLAELERRLGAAGGP